MAMPRSLQVRDVPDDLHAELKARAAALGVSLSDYVLGALDELASRPAVSDVLRRASRRRGGASTTDIVDAVRRERDGK